ncbi:MAG TPA: efflux RND transporter periplasmic adaptor subunit [Thermoanaerobaculia bacterium]|nr:efflux RND transporter periplasmic adaptor subunit [Thermoanaerobaculia bacterium]
MRRKYLWLTLGMVALSLVLGGWAFFRRDTASVEVQVATVGREDLQAKVTANGKVQAQKKVDISATIAGQITHLAVQEGDRVRKGQFLLQIDSANPRSMARSSEASMEALLRDLESARAALEQARADFRRAEGNHRAGILSESDFEKVRTSLATAQAVAGASQRRVDQARATFEGARDLLSKTTIRAPMDGIITAKRVEEGEVAVIGVQNSPGTVLLTISDMSVVETEMEVDETSIPAVKVGQEARVHIDAYPNRTFNGVVTEVGSSPMAATAGATATEAIKFMVKVQLAAPPAGIKPGLSVQADILTGFRGRALVIPIQALVLRDSERERERKAGAAAPPPGAPREQEGVYLMAGGKARFQPIKTGLMGELSVEVLDGLRGGETLVTGPFKALRTLKPGDRLKLEKPKLDSGGRAAG